MSLNEEEIEHRALQIAEQNFRQLTVYAANIRRLGRQVIADIIEIGLILTDAKALVGHGNWLSWLDGEFGWSERTARNYITVYEMSKSANFADLNLPLTTLYKLASSSVPAEVRQEILQRAEAGERISARMVEETTGAAQIEGQHIRGTFGTGENEWYTPARVIEAARAVLGVIDLDPASSEIAQRTVKAARFFTKEVDGLAQDWKGRVWLNPPYAQPYIEDFADKMIAQVKCKNITSAIMLTHNYTDTAWFQKLMLYAGAICFTQGRIRFESPEGELASPTQGQAFFYFGEKPGEFFEVFRPFGSIVRVAR